MERRRNIEARRQAFSAWMQREGVTQSEVSRRAGVPKTTLSSFVNGKSDSLLGTTQDKIARAFSTTTHAIFDLASPTSTVGVWGYIEAGLGVHPVRSYDDPPIREVGHDMIVDPAMRYVAFEIVGHTIPTVDPGWLAICERGCTDDLSNLVGRICVVDTADGQRLMRRVRPGYIDGHYNLEGLDGSPMIENARVIRAVRLVGYREPSPLIGRANAA